MRNRSFLLAALCLLALPGSQAALAIETETSPEALAQVELAPPATCEDINAAIEALPAKGGVVKLAEGTFVCHEPVVLDRDNVALIGAGRTKTVLQLPAKHPLPVLVIGAMQVAKEATPKHGDQYYPVREVNNIMVANLTTDGNFQGDAPANDEECYDTAERKSKSCDGDGGRFIRNNGVTIRRAKNVKISNVAAVRNYSGGMVLEKRSSFITVDGFTATENSFDGFAGYETHSSLFKNMNLYKNILSGISIDFDFTKNTFDHVKLIDNGDNGVFSHSIGNITYKNMIVKGNGNFGVYIDGIRRNGQLELGTCDNNDFYNVKFEGNGLGVNRNPDAAIRFNHECKGIDLVKVSIIRAKASQQCVSTWPGAEVRYGDGYECR